MKEGKKMRKGLLIAVTVLAMVAMMVLPGVAVMARPGEPTRSPMVIDVDPDSGSQGTTLYPVTVTGSGFECG